MSCIGGRSPGDGSAPGTARREQITNKCLPTIQMKKEHLYIALLISGFIGLLWIAIPIKEILNQYFSDELINKLNAGIITRFFILLILIGIVKKFKFENFNGVGKVKSVANIHALILPCGFIAIGIMSNWSNYIDAGLILFLLFTTSVFLVGFVEEFAFRGIILPLFIQSFFKKRYVLYISIVATSLAFGAIHFINFFRQPDNLPGIIRQMFFALSIGVFFGGLLLRTESIIVVSFFHGLVNFAFGADEINRDIQKEIVEKSNDAINWSSVIPTTLFFAFILFGGLYMIRKVDREAVLRKLEPLTKDTGEA